MEEFQEVAYKNLMRIPWLITTVVGLFWEFFLAFQCDFETNNTLCSPTFPSSRNFNECSPLFLRIHMCMRHGHVDLGELHFCALDFCNIGYNSNNTHIVSLASQFSTACFVGPLMSAATCTYTENDWPFLPPTKPHRRVNAIQNIFHIFMPMSFCVYGFLLLKFPAKIAYASMDGNLSRPVVITMFYSDPGFFHSQIRI